MNILKALDNLGIYLSRNAEQEIVEHIGAKVELTKSDIRSQKVLNKFLKGDTYRGHKITINTDGLTITEKMIELEIMSKKINVVKQEYKVANIINEVKRTKAIERAAVAKVKLIKAKEKKEVVQKITKVAKNNPMNEIRTVEENIIADNYEPQATHKDPVIQAVSDMIETHIVATTINKDGLTELDFKLNGKTFFTMGVNSITSPETFAPSINTKKREDTPYTYNFNQAHKIHNTFTNRHRQYRDIQNTINITININKG